MKCIKLTVDGMGRYVSMEERKVSGKLADWYVELNCDTIDVVSVGNNIIAIVDDNGLFNNMFATVFSIGYEKAKKPEVNASPLAGNILFFGTDCSGETIDIPNGVKIDIHAMVPSQDILDGGDIRLMDDKGKVIQTIPKTEDD